MPAGTLTGRVLAATLAVVTLGACSETATAPGEVACDEQNTRYCRAGVGDLVETTLSEVHPTQPSLGYDEVFYRLGRYTDTPDKLLDDWCATNGQKGLKAARPRAAPADPASFTCQVGLGSETPATIAAMKTAVVGPGGRLYLTDGHHSLTAFWEAPGAGPGTPVRLRITANLSHLSPDQFWHTMASHGWTWLRDVNGDPVTPDRLPPHLGLHQFSDDKYRGVLFFVRDIGYTQDDSSPAFHEFYWGQWLRSRTEPGLRLENFDLTNEGSYLTLIADIATAMVALPDTTEVSDGHTAASLGKRNTFGQKAFDALAQPAGAPRPGKLSYAIAFKAAH